MTLQIEQFSARCNPKLLEALKGFCEEYSERRLRSNKEYFENPGQWYAWIAIEPTILSEKEVDIGDVVGFTAYKPDKKEMDSFTVTKRTYRGTGLGQALLKAKLDHARERGNQRYITTIGCTNVASINLVLKAGFVLIRAEAREYGNILVFEQELNR